MTWNKPTVTPYSEGVRAHGVPGQGVSTYGIWPEPGSPAGLIEASRHGHAPRLEMPHYADERQKSARVVYNVNSSVSVVVYLVTDARRDYARILRAQASDPPLQIEITSVTLHVRSRRTSVVPVSRRIHVSVQTARSRGATGLGVTSKELS